MVTVADAKARLGIIGAADDELLEQLLEDARTYLARIGVAVDPESGPVGSAIVVIAGTLLRRSKDHGTRQEIVEGIGSRSSFDPASLDEADWMLVRRLCDPYREVTL